jgi:thiol-disulfide isomerase/thioredoxin
VIAAATAQAPGTQNAAVGARAPNGTFTTSTGTTRTISSLSRRPTLLWFVSTWCSSCQAGTQTMASQIQVLARLHVRVVELELADDLGQPGPSITAFARQLAGPAATNPDWSFGVASAALTNTYDPASYLDIYYLLDSTGHISYVNSSPAATMSQLIGHAEQIT